ncbi:Flp pilus assembly protein CpaB [Ammoniphilus sp. 3BR4]|uniref:Flp pilus assembly protein CpaB n=1 Tax=Ammoniphilus sp. 3BR4 TaxID=3158265 RepID=UPI003467DA79
MNTRKIWLGALVFGLMATAIVYLLLFPSSNAKPAATEPPPPPQANEEPKEGEVKPEAAPVALEIAEGKRAITVNINEVQGVSGFIVPGDFVDVISLHPHQILLQHVRVLAVGKSISAPKPGEKNEYRTITLEVLPTEGLAVAMIETSPEGSFHLMLRSREDRSTTPHKHITPEQLGKGEIPK